MPNDWLKTEHPIYENNKALWEKMERRFYGGEDVLAELTPFRWEADYYTEAGTEVANFEGRRSLSIRRDQAVYINYPHLFARTMVGHMMRQAPPPEQGLSFGTLGPAGRREGSTERRTRGELVYYNADGVGNDGSQWDNFWARVAENSFATGHRWVMVEATQERPTSLRDEMEGKRPYLVEYSPLSVINWHFSSGKLDFAVVRTSERNPMLDGDRLVGNEDEALYLLMVRQGFEGFGETYQRGGWWIFDADCEPVEDRKGDWSRTGGEIPMWVHFYERSKREGRMSRPGIVEVSQAAVSIMNLSSAADFDAWDAASSMLFMLGADEKSFNTAAAKLREGAKWVPVPPVEVGMDKAQVPQIHDGSTGAVVAQVFETRLNRKQEEAYQAAALEATSEPGSSGVSKMAGFADVKAPRLALLASEMESSQNTAIHFLERRWQSGQPTGSVAWRREFELLPLIDSIREVFEIAELAQVRSVTLTENAIDALVRRKGLAADDEDAERILAEIRESFGGSLDADRQELDAEIAEREAAEAVLAAVDAGGQGDFDGLEPGVNGTGGEA